MSFVLIEKDDNYLLIKEASEKWPGNWFFPGGKVEENELPEKAAIRETKEEAGCEVSLEGIFYFRFLNQQSGQDMHIYYLGKTTDACLKQHADEHSLEARWFDYRQVTQLQLRQDALEVIDYYRSAVYGKQVNKYNQVKE